MEEHGVHLDHEGERPVGDVLVRGHGDGVADDDHRVMYEKLVTGSFSEIIFCYSKCIDYVSKSFEHHNSSRHFYDCNLNQLHDGIRQLFKEASL